MSKLRSDYERKLVPIYDSEGNFTREELITFITKTPHYAYETAGGGFRTLIVDEFTCLDFRILTDLVLLVRPEKVILVGDVKQTRIRDLSEGIFIGDKIDLGNIQNHYLTVCYRCQPYIVAIMNKLYYDGLMRSARFESGDVTNDVEIRIWTNGVMQTDTDVFPIAFSKLVARDLVENEKNTVRSAQGGTYPKVALYITKDDEYLLNLPCLSIVALTRHEQKLIIYHDDSEVTKCWISKHHLNDKEFLEMIM